MRRPPRLDLQLGQQVLHLGDFGRLVVDDLLRQVQRLRVLTVLDLLLRHVDRALVVLDHLLEEQR